MKMWIKGAVTALMLASAASATPGIAAASEPTAWLYELTENMSVNGLKNPHRKASSELMGYAQVGSPLCPKHLVESVSPGAPYCTVNASGADSISLTTGLGVFGGSFTVVVQDVNVFDSPEVVVARGRFHGKMDFSLAMLQMIPVGYVDGFMVIDGSKKIPFKGTFRLPTAFIADSRFAEHCRVAAPPEWCVKPFYLLDGFQSKVDVRENEKALGYPTVRFEITF
jgi:hypothetical protein